MRRTVMSAADLAWFYRPEEGQIPSSLARAGHQAGQRKISEVGAMKFATKRPTLTLKPPPAS